jgi:Zn finger protein HypA/HybF involved in hydrogenase expression
MKENTRIKKENQLIQKVKAIFGDKYETKYIHFINRNTPVKLFCNICNNFFEKTPEILLHKCGCPYCSKQHMSDLMSSRYSKTSEDFIQKAKHIHGDHFDYSKVEYVNGNTKVLIKCNTCNKEFYQTPIYHYKIKDCPYCSREKRRENNVYKNKIYRNYKPVLKYDDASAINMIKSIHGDKYGYDQVKYIGSNKPVKIYCKECKRYVDVIFRSLLSGSGCPICSRKNQRVKLMMTNDEFIKKSKAIFGDYLFDYSKTLYRGYNSKIILKCNKHNYEFEQTASNHLNGNNGCPFCINYKQEQIIGILLKLYNISFEREKTFDWLIYKSNMSLDFYLPYYNVAIEYQNEQHFKPINFNGLSYNDLLNNFNDIKKRDEIKKILCNNNGLKIFYINYYDNIYEKLYDILLYINAISKNNSLFTEKDINFYGNDLYYTHENNLTHSPIIQYSLDHKIISEYDNIYEISKQLGIVFSNYEFRTILNKNKEYHGYIWKLKGRGFHYSICQYEKDGRFIASYSSMKEASIKSNSSYEGIKKCIHGNQLTCGGFIWKAEYIRKKRKTPLKSCKKVFQYNIDGKLINEYISISSAADSILHTRKKGISKKQICKNISKCLHNKTKTSYGYIWKFK